MQVLCSVINFMLQTMTKEADMQDKVMRMPAVVHGKLEAMRAVLRTMTGRPITQAETLERALQCLADSHGRGAWLTGVEAGRVMEERHQKQLTAAVGQVLAAYRPDLTLRGIGFDPANGRAYIDVEGQQPLTLGAAALSQMEGS